jgi:hypothetical protein
MPRFRTHPTHAALLSDIITIGYGLPNSTRRSQLEDTSISVPSDRSFMGANIDGLIRIPVQLSSTDVLQLDTGRERIRDERLLDPLGISVGVVRQRTMEPAIEDPAEGSFGSSRSALHNPLLDATAVVAVTTQLSDGPPAPDTRVPGSIAGPARPGLAGAPGSTTAIHAPDRMEAQRRAVAGYGLSQSALAYVTAERGSRNESPKLAVVPLCPESPQQQVSILLKTLRLHSPNSAR